ncbi:hypothetical protein BaRGS_00013004, partial [Batillaria attramentaria]
MNDMTSPECRSDREITQAVSASQDEDVTVPKEVATQDDVAGTVCGRGQLVVNVPQHSGGDINIGGEVNTTHNHNQLHQHFEFHGPVRCQRLVQICVGHHGDQEAGEERSEAIEETPTLRAESPSCVETDHLAEAASLLEERRRVVLCGPPGSGKTTLGHALLAHCKGFRPSAVSNVSELSVRIGGKGEVIVLMDGVLGEVRVDDRECRALRAVLRSVLDSIKVGKCRLVLTMYPHIIREIRSSDLYSFSSLIQSTDVIEIQSRGINEEQKRAMLEMHFRELHLETDRQDALVTEILQKDVSGAAFPWCCWKMVYNWKSMSDPTVFFVAPSESHVPLLQRMLHDPEHGEAFAAVLSLRMWGVACFFPHSPGQMRSRLELLGFRDFSPDRLKEYAHILKGSILNENGDSFQNRVVYDAVGLALGRSSRLHVLLRVCDVRFLVQHVRTKETATEFSVAIGTSKDDRQLLMQTMYEHIVGGRLPELCQHPSLHWPQFLQEFEAFCRERKNYVQALASAVDPVHRMPLLYWSIWGPSGHLTEWCLRLFDAQTHMTVLTDVFVKSEFAVAVMEHFLEMDTTRVLMTRHALQYVMTRSENMTGEIRFPLPSDEQCITDDMQASKTRVREHVQSGTYNSFQSPSFSVSDSQISMHVSDDAEAVSVLVSCKDFHLAFTGLMQGEAEQRDEGNRLLHVAADSGDLDAVKISAQNGAYPTSKDTSNQSSSELEATWINGTHNSDSCVQVTAQNQLRTDENTWFENETGSVVFTEECVADDDRAVAKRSVNYGHTAEQYSADDQPVACDERGGQSVADDREYQPVADNYSAEQPVADNNRAEQPVADNNSAEQPVADNNRAEQPVADNNRAEQPVADNNRAEQPVAGGVRAEEAAIRTRMWMKWSLVILFLISWFVVIGPLLIRVYFDENNSTPLQTSLVDGGYRQISHFLVEFTSGFNAWNTNDFRSLYRACLNGETEIVDQLLQGNNDDINRTNENGFACIHAAIYNNHTRTARVLIMHGADVNVKGSGITPLYLAAVYGQIEIAKLLIRRGADVNQNLEEGRVTPLHVVSESGRTEFAILLIASNADVNAKTKDGFTPLFYAILHDHLDIVRLLLQNGADVNTRIKHWTSPLFLACTRGRTGIVERLLLKGADINITDRLARTPLHVACENKHTETARLLVSRGAKLHAKDAKGFTPLDYAVMSGDLEIVDLLITRKLQVSSDPHEEYYKINNVFVRMPNQREDSGDTPLHLACSYGQTEIASRLINSTVADVDARNNRRLSPLHQAAHFGHTEIAYLLIQNHADVNARDKDLETPLHLAALSGHTMSTRLLTGSHADVNAKNVHGITPLYYASSAGNTKTARLLINSGADINMKDELGHTPFHMACWHGHTETARLLIQNGAHINMKSSHGNTALHYACSSGFNETVIILIKSGADISMKSSHGNTALHYACSSGFNETVIILIKSGANISVRNDLGSTPLYSACASGHTQIASLLLQRGADITAVDKNGDSPLHVAVAQNQREAVRFLIQNKADINALNVDGFSPLHSATKAGHAEIAVLLIQSNASVSIRNREGNTPLHFACDVGETETVRFLISRGADIDIDNNFGLTPFSLAACRGHFETARLLLQHKADINRRSTYGYTALYYASLLGQTESALFLIENGADVNMKDNEGSTSLHATGYSGQQKTARLLIRHHADVHTKDNSGRTPLHIACEYGSKGVVRLLLESKTNISSRDNEGNTPLHLVSRPYDPVFSHRLRRRRSSPSLTQYVDIARLLIERNADVDAMNNDRNTPLHIAFGFRDMYNEELIRILIKNTAEINVKDRSGKTLVHKASRRNHNTDILRLLITRQADINATDSFGMTALHVACLDSYNQDNVRLLVEHNADVNGKDIWGKTPLHYAPFSLGAITRVGIKVFAKHVDSSLDDYKWIDVSPKEKMVRILLDRGADVNAKDVFGSTPLHIASESGDAKVAGLLIERKADVNTKKTMNNYTPLHSACFAGKKEVVLRLLQNNADVNAKSRTGKTPLDLARERNHTDVIKILAEYANQGEYMDHEDPAWSDWRTSDAMIDPTDGWQDAELNMATVEEMLADSGMTVEPADDHNSEAVDNACPSEAGEMMPFIQLQDFQPSFLQFNSEATIDSDRSHYVYTDDMDNAVDALDTHGRVVLCGPPGCGKTFLAHALLRRYRRRGFKPYIITCLQDWHMHIGGEGRQSIALMDGALGKVRVDWNKHEQWQAIACSVRELNRTRDCLLVLTLYPHILRELHVLDTDSNSPLLQSMVVVHLMKDPLDVELKREMLTVHLNELHLDTAEQDALVTKILQKDVSGAAFPWCCRQLAKMLKSRPVSDISDDDEATPLFQNQVDHSYIFKSPCEAHVALLQRMLRDTTHGETMAVVMSMTMLGLGRFLHNPCRVQPQLEKLGFRVFSDYRLEEYADFLKGSILNENGDGFQSRVIYDAVGLAMGSSFSLPILLKVCDARFLLQHVLMKKTATQLSVTIGPSPDDRQLLMQTIYEHIVSGRLPELCQHPFLHCPQFLQEFGTFCRADENHLQQLLSSVDPVHEMPLLYWSLWSQSGHLAQWCIGLTDNETTTTLSAEDSVKVMYACALVLQDEQNQAQLALKGILQVVRETVKRQIAVLAPVALPLPSEELCMTEQALVTRNRVISQVQSGSVYYLGRPLLSLPNTLVGISMSRVGDVDTVISGIPDQKGSLAFRLLTDVEVDEKDEEGNTLLHVAASVGDMDAVTVAVKSGASLTIRNNMGLTPPQLATSRLNGLRSKKRGFSIFHFWKKKQMTKPNSLHEACKKGDKDAVKILLCSSATVHDKDSVGNTPLHAACMAGQTNIAALLISLGANVGALDMYGNTPLHDACRLGQHDIALYLVQNNAEVRKKNKKGRTPLQYAETYGHTEAAQRLKDTDRHLLNTAGNYLSSVIAWFVRWRSNRSRMQSAMSYLIILLFLRVAVDPLSVACRLGRTAYVDFLIQHGADVNARDTERVTPLHAAAWAGCAECVQRLIQHGADVNARNREGYTPLHSAARSGCTECARILIENGAHVNVLSDKGITPLHCAVMYGGTESVRLLIQHGADVNCRDDNWMTPLNMACISGQTEPARVLIQHGADVDRANDVSMTPLHHACMNGNTELARLLLQNTANVDAKDKNWKTPLHYACINDDVRLVLLLIQNKADVNLMDNNHKTPLHYASKYRRRTTAHLLMANNALVNREHKTIIIHLVEHAGRQQTLRATFVFYNHPKGNTERRFQSLSFGFLEKTEDSPLHYACWNGDAKTVKRLLEHGAVVDLNDTYGFTPLHYAEFSADAATIFLLKQKANAGIEPP